MDKVERLNKKDPNAIKEMFNHISKDYDRLNKIVSFGMHTSWLKKCIKEMSSPSYKEVLDLATGTGDIALSIRKANPQTKVVGLDLSDGMLAIAREKAEKADYSKEALTFIQGDALHMPFEDNRFDAVSISFGIRNFMDIPAGLEEIHRVLKPEGKLCILELCEPTNPILRSLYRFYSQTFIPFVGGKIAHDKEAYEYLPNSIRKCPQRASMCQLMKAAGFSHTTYHSFFPGVCTMYIGKK